MCLQAKLCLLRSVWRGRHRSSAAHYYGYSRHRIGRSSILDVKRADIGNTNASYVGAAFDFLQADVITIHPYLGAKSLEPFYRFVARRVANEWNKNGNCALVVGATHPDELRDVRGLVGDMPILIPGIGAQGGDVEKTVTAGKDSHEQGMIINSSRGIIFASKDADFAEATRRETEKLRNLINNYL